MTTTFVAQFGRYVLHAVSLIALCGCLDANILAADPEPIDFNRAQQLFNRAKQGEKLSPEDQAYHPAKLSAQWPERQFGPV